jgi:transcriptional regulator with XRE-family HTH domain
MTENSESPAIVAPHMAVWRDAIRALLRERGMTQQELARLAGISRSTVLHILRGGHCSTETLERVAGALDVDVAELFTAPLDLGVRRDRMIAAVLRELSDSVSAAVMADLRHRRKRTLGSARKTARRLPFAE